MSPAEQPQSAPDELLSVSSVARRLGVAPATLRTWARRYGLGPSSHEAGSHRKYCPSDLAKLTVMRRLISAGVAPADAAEQAKAHEGEVIIEESRRITARHVKIMEKKVLKINMKDGHQLMNKTKMK